MKPMMAITMAGVLAPILMLGAAAADERPVAWEGRGGLSYVSSDDFQGGGVSATLLRPGRYLAAGFHVDAVYAGASGVTRDFGEQPYSFSFLSIMLGGLAQLRVHVGPVIPYVELAVGLADAVTVQDENTQCSYGLGLAGGAGAGFTVEIGHRMAIGARGSARTIAGSFECTDSGGPATFDTVVLYAGGATFDLRW
jgi:hypothetical protein